jgi:hypothetical protein
MGIEQRKYIRFSLDIPAVRYTKYGEAIETVIRQISVGGCLAEWDEDVYIGDEFRMLVRLPNKNFLPLVVRQCINLPTTVSARSFRASRSLSRIC